MEIDWDKLTTAVVQQFTKEIAARMHDTTPIFEYCNEDNFTHNRRGTFTMTTATYAKSFSQVTFESMRKAADEMDRELYGHAVVTELICADPCSDKILMACDPGFGMSKEKAKPAMFGGKYMAMAFKMFKDGKIEWRQITETYNRLCRMHQVDASGRLANQLFKRNKIGI